jgi:hypothetical protein
MGAGPVVNCTCTGADFVGDPDPFTLCSTARYDVLGARLEKDTSPLNTPVEGLLVPELGT